MKKKRTDFQLLRLFAIFGVVFNHTQELGFELCMTPGCTRVNYYGSLLLGILCETAVPLFLLVSGGLLLDRDEPIRVVLKKRVLRMAVVLIGFSGLLYGFWTRWGYIEAPGLWDFLRRLWSNGISTPYWYLYAYLGLLLMLPLLRPMVRAMRDSAFLYLALLHVLLFGLGGTWGVLSCWGELHQDFLIYFAEPTLFYFIMGYYLACRFPWARMERRHLALSWLAAALSVGWMLLLAHLQLRRGFGMLNYHRSLILFPVFAVYASVHRFCTHPHNARAERLVETLGGCVFGTYLMEGVLRHYLRPFCLALAPRLHLLPACLVWVAAVVLAGLAITWALKQLPLLRKLL